MEMMSAVSAFLGQLPVYLAWFAGVVAAIINWRKHPRVSLIVVIVVLAFFVASLAGTYLNIWLSMNVSGDALANIFLVKGLVQSVLNAVLWGLVFLAVFGWRTGSKAA